MPRFTVKVLRVCEGNRNYVRDGRYSTADEAVLKTLMRFERERPDDVPESREYEVVVSEVRKVSLPLSLSEETGAARRRHLYRLGLHHGSLARFLGISDGALHTEASLALFAGNERLAPQEEDPKAHDVFMWGIHSALNFWDAMQGRMFRTYPDETD